MRHRGAAVLVEGDMGDEGSIPRGHLLCFDPA